jgi:hypothetical protein
MTQDEIIEMARQVGMIKDGEWWFSSFYKTEQDVHISHLEDFAKLVAQHEREACAIVCDDLWEDDGTAYECADAIRARGQA